MRTKRNDPSKLFASELQYLINKSRTDEAFRITESAIAQNPGLQECADNRLTGKSIALLSGKSQRTMSTYVRGDVIPSAKTRDEILGAIAKAIGKEPNALFDDIPVINLDDFTEEREDEKAARKKDLCDFFCSLNESAQQYIMEHFDAFRYALEDDLYLTMAFPELPERDRNYLLSLLDRFVPRFEQIQNILNRKNNIKMTLYHEMTYQYQANQFLQQTNRKRTGNVLLSQFEKQIAETNFSFDSNNLAYLLHVEPQTWYFLYAYYRLRCFEIQEVSADHAIDPTLCSLISQSIYQYIGDKYGQIMHSRAPLIRVEQQSGRHCPDL